MIRVAVIPVGEKVQVKEIEEEHFLEELYGIIGCRCVEAFGPLYGDEPCLFIDDEGVFTQKPNRAVFANKHMVECGCISQVDYSGVVQEGQLYTILFGSIVAVGYETDSNEELKARSITDEELQSLRDDFDKDVDSGLKAAFFVHSRKGR